MLRLLQFRNRFFAPGTALSADNLFKAFALRLTAGS
jgi:hypothetical protein